MKKLMIMIWIILICLLKVNVLASSIGCIKFYVDMSSNGYSGDVTVFLTQDNNPSNKVSFKLNKYGSEWTYFVDPGVYHITVKDGYEDEWNIAYDCEKFSINGNEEHACNIIITKKNGNVNDNDVGEAYQPVEDSENNDNNTVEEVDEDKNITSTANHEKEDNRSSLMFAGLIASGLIVFVIVIWLAIKAMKREN